MENKLYKKWKDSLTITAKEKRVPIAGQFELTPRCNLDCKMCYIHGANSNSLRDQELSTETWMRIFDEAYDMGLMFAVLTGGECLLRHDFKELYLHLWTKRIRITIFTNGILIDDNYVEFFKKYPPEQIRISLYGSCEAAYRNLTGHEGFQKVISAYQKLFEAKIPVGVAVTPSSYMKDDFIHIRRFCLENGIKGHNPNYYLTKNRDFPDKNDHNLTIDEIISLASADKMLRSQLNPNENTPAPCGNCTEAPVGLACGAGRSSALVSWNGIMHPCVSIPEGTASLLEVSYASAWEATKAIVDEMLSGAECVGCPYDSVCHKCPAIRLTSLHSGHCNPDMCELTRRMVAAGIKKLNHKAEECD